MPNLANRHRQAELMDQPGLDSGQHRLALQGLQRVNFWSRSAGILWPQIRELAGSGRSRPLRLLDIACGAGDVAVKLWKIAQRQGIALQVVGADVSPAALQYAKEHAQSSGADVDFKQIDAIEGNLPHDFDIIACSLFLHHLDEPQAVGLLERMSQAARQLVLISDLRRSQFGYLLAYYGGRLLSRSPILHVDGPLSVEGAFTETEAMKMAHQAGMKNARITRHWPQRFLMTWRR